MPDFDLLIIGTGVTGRAAADEALAAGMHVALVDRRGFGGTCALRGCEPKKVLFAGAEAVERAVSQKDIGVGGDTSLDWRRLIAFERRLTDPTPAAIEKSYVDSGARTLHGSARFVGPTAIRIGDETYSAKWILIATGAMPMPLGIEGEDLVIDSERFMNTDALPERIVFVGGGYISFEFAAMARTAGSGVTILHRGAAPLEQFDADLVAMLASQYVDAGIDVRVNSPVARVSRGGDGLLVELADGTTVECDLAVHGAGRIPDLTGLGLDVGGVAYGRHGVEVDEGMRSVSNARVYAAGDAAAFGVPLTPVGVAQGRIAVRNMLEPGSARFDPPATPSIVFSYPPLAAVGIREADVRAGGLDAEVKFTDTSDWWSSRRVGLHHTGAKTIVDRQSGRIIGAHLLGHGADEAVNLFALMIDQGVTADDAKRVLWGYPTACSEIVYLL